MRRAHSALGIEPSSYQLSLRGPGGKYVGDGWDEAEQLLRKALVEAGADFQEVTGEAAFYGPKIDVQIMDPAGRETTLSTIQVDFHQPEAFDLSYVDAAGDKVRPVMVHRSLAGSMERLFAHLIEVHAGAFPVWYAPVQIVAVPIGEPSAATAFVRAAIDAGLRARVDAEGSLGARIRAARKVPYVAVIGEREAAAGEVSLRLRDGRQLPAMPAAAAVDLVRGVAAARSA